MLACQDVIVVKIRKKNLKIILILKKTHLSAFFKPLLLKMFIKLDAKATEN